MESSSQAIARATRVLYFYATTQIDELLAIASSELSQRWDFLGPQAKIFASAEFFSEVDAALLWHKSDIDIGEFIRHSHFALELTDEQAEILCEANVRFEAVDGKVHALAPFANVDTEESLALAVDLMMEDGEWRYFDIVACKGSAVEFQSPRNSKLHLSYEEVCANFSDQAKSAIDDDDDYWGQYSEEEEEQETKEENTATTEPTTMHLIAEAGRHALMSAAAAMRAQGVTEDQFVALARRAFRGDSEYNLDRFF
ncbi:hypothetical protein GGI03_002791 [Coemansia sp. RSA 2337]|nr:hypothetical protein H4S04_000592 [Coemansia sp. S16]KAJ2070008.1 hypothetical protein GGI08_000055 [Coemansia sp. S2]KAJ2354401.1 hypothetical protein GGH92_000064 [Coemansia sp. RSA 2673]KAJ2465200.1 hypothetical protein GGI03_002791 [Coemansia sp. RSA 2337]